MASCTLKVIKSMTGAAHLPPRPLVGGGRVKGGGGLE